MIVENHQELVILDKYDNFQMNLNCDNTLLAATNRQAKIVDLPFVSP